MNEFSSNWLDFFFRWKLKLYAFGKSKNSQGDNEISGDFWESSKALSFDIGAKGVAENMNKFIKDKTLKFNGYAVTKFRINR